jgi:hypothetical protein
MPSHLRQLALVVAAPLLIVAALLNTACEEKVVRTRFGGNGASDVLPHRSPNDPLPVPQVSVTQPSNDGPLEATGRALKSTGDFLFGWTKPGPTYNITNNNTYLGNPEPTSTPKTPPQSLPKPE